MTTQTLAGDVGGNIVMKANGVDYVCTNLQLTMRINDIPTAVVTLGSGYFLGDPKKKQNAGDLLSAVLKKRDSAYLDTVECTITEDSIVIFKGCIVTGTVVYQAGDRTVRAVRFLCMHNICKLMARPLSAFTNVSGSRVINSVGKVADFNPEVCLAQANHFTNGTVSLGSILMQYMSRMTKGSRLHEVVSTIIDAIVYSGSYVADKNKIADDNYAHVKDYITSNYTLNEEECGETCRLYYIFDIGEHFMSMLAGASIFEAIKNTMTSDSFMLQLIPGFGDAEKNKFRLEPSAAWIKQTPVVIDEKYINGIHSSYNPVACINTPEVFMVNFSHAVTMLQGGDNKSWPECLKATGVFSTNKDISDALKKQIESTGSIQLGSMANRLYKAKVYPVPKWFLPNFVEKATSRTKAEDMKQDLKSNRRKESSKDKEVAADSVKPAKTLDLIKARKLGDTIAKALFTLIYGGQDTAIVYLLPSVRFGKVAGIDIENNIGKLMDIKFSNTTAGLSIRGVITKVEYTYEADSTGKQGYTVLLTRVRPLDAAEESVECPIYKKIEDTK